MSAETSAITKPMKSNRASLSKQRLRRRAVWVGAAVVVLAAIAIDTKGVRIGSSEDLRTAGFSPVAYGQATFPKIKAAIEEKAVDAKELMAALKEDAQAATQKYGVATDSGPIFSVKLQGVAEEKPVMGIYQLKVDDLPDIMVRVQTGPAINGTELRDATGSIKFGEFTNQIDYQNAGSALNNAMKSEILSKVDTAALAGKTISLVGAFRLINPKNWLITPVQLEVH